MTPGGGLKQLDLLPGEAEFILENTISAPAVPDSGYGGSEDAGPSSLVRTPKLVPIRTYCSNDDMYVNPVITLVLQFSC